MGQVYTNDGSTGETSDSLPIAGSEQVLSTDDNGGENTDADTSGTSGVIDDK